MINDIPCIKAVSHWFFRKRAELRLKTLEYQTKAERSRNYNFQHFPNRQMVAENLNGEILRREFYKNQYISIEKRRELAKQTGLRGIIRIRDFSL